MFDWREIFYRSDGTRRSCVNLLIIAINILVFLVLEIKGDTEDALFMYAHGAMFPPALFESGEWYRIFTAMFMHFGLTHLVNNMLVLFFMGDTLERLVGKLRYLIIYLGSGVTGCICSNYIMMRSEDTMAVGAGASGAVFGVFGALFYIVLVHKGHIEGLSIKRLILFIVLTLYSGYTSEGVDNVAHLGGLIAGFVLGLLLVRIRKRKGAEESSIEDFM